MFSIFEILNYRYLNDKFGASIFITCNFDLSPMCLYNIITQTQSQSRSLSCWFGSEKWLEDFVFDRIRNAGAVVGDDDLYFIGYVFSINYDEWGIIRVIAPGP